MAVPTAISNAGGAVAAAAGVVAQQALDQAQQLLVDKWLQDTTTTIGAATHIASMLAQEVACISLTPLAGNFQYRTDAEWNAISYAQQLHLPPEAAEFMNKSFGVFQQPNIEGITIFTENEVTHRTMDVSEQPLVVQQTEAATTYATDNAVPHPREWTLKGYIASALPTDNYLVLKPSLILQRQYLDNCMKSRRPVWFKTYDNTFSLVLITDMQTEWNTKGTNNLFINISLKEFVPITITEGPLSGSIAKFAKKLGSGVL